jgi:hypothetical protein
VSARHIALYAFAAMLAVDCAVGADEGDASRDVVRADVTDVDGSDAPIEAAADVPLDAGPPADALPQHAVMFFATNACPAGWMPFEMARGRYVMPTFRAGSTGTRGAVLASGEDRTHGHTASVAFDLASVSFAGASGSSGPAAAMLVTLDLAIDAASATVPYVQLLACEKTGPTATHAVPVPRGMLIYVYSATCPSGFTQPLDPQGRVPIGLPPGAPNGATWGGAPVSTGDPIRHQHAVGASFTTAPHGVALASGCCADGFARDGTYSASTTTDLEEVDLPRLQLLQCQKD